MKAEFTRQMFEQFLIEELRGEFPDVQLSAVAASKPDGTTEWVIEVRQPVKCYRIFRPELKGEVVRAKIFAAELAVLIKNYLIVS